MIGFSAMQLGNSTIKKEKEKVPQPILFYSDHKAWEAVEDGSTLSYIGLPKLIIIESIYLY